MNEDHSKKRLGRGLAALIGEMDRPAPREEKQAARLLPPTAACRSSSYRPIRKTRAAISPKPSSPISRSRSASTASSSRCWCAASADGRYEIIAGERRWRAAQRAGLTEIPVLVRDVDDRTALELAIIENVQRADLNPVEEALGYQQLIDEHNYTQADLGNVIGKSRSHVANTLRLLKLPEVIRDLLVDGALSAGHARTLVTAADPAGLAKRIVEGGLSVRQAEALAQQPDAGAPKRRKPPQAADKDADTLALEKLLSDVTGLNVAISHKERGGEVKISYRTLEQLDDLCRRLQQ